MNCKKYFFKYSPEFFQQKEFKLTRTLLFDGESGLKSKKAQQEIYAKFQIKVHAQPYFKRNTVERFVKEIKLRSAILCELKGMKI